MAEQAPHLDVALAAPLREALLAADYTVDSVTELLGPQAYAALQRNETTPGERATRDGSALETLTRLFLLQLPVAVTQVEAVLPTLLPGLISAGVVAGAGPEVRALLDVRPYAAGQDDLWIVADLTPGLNGSPNAVSGDYVLGISPASTNLAQQTLRHPVGRALDLGSGCGVQALHLARHSDEVVATDVNPRALAMTRFNAALNGISCGVGRGIEVREGSLFEPVADERFDLIATNPPFVISPATGERLVYRDSGLPGDQVVADIVREAPDRLADGGWCQVLANWSIVAGREWDERLSSWLSEEVDAFVIQREVLDPAAYVELWLKDAGLHGGPDYLQRYDDWLGWLESEGVRGIGFGWINLRKSGPRVGAVAPVRTFLDWPYEVEQPISGAIASWAAAQDALAATPDLLGARLTARADVRQETVGQPGAEDPERILLRQQRGLRRARTVDTIEAALFGACDGDLTIGQILAALAQLTDTDSAALARDYLPSVQAWVAEGYLDPS